MGGMSALKADMLDGMATQRNGPFIRWTLAGRKNHALALVARTDAD